MPRNDDKPVYPDISDILQRKLEGRREAARRSFGEKIAMMEALRERLEPFRRAREKRRAARLGAQGAAGAPETSRSNRPSWASRRCH